MHYMLFYDYTDDYMERRHVYRDVHLAGAKEAADRGELIMAGGFTELPFGAALVFKVEDPAIIERFVESDPYVQNGLVRKWTIRPWTVVVGAD